MSLEPWKVMIGLSVVLAIYGLAVYLGISSPAQLVLYLILGGGILVAMWFGYRLGNRLAED